MTKRLVLLILVVLTLLFFSGRVQASKWYQVIHGIYAGPNAFLVPLEAVGAEVSCGRYRCNEIELRVHFDGRGQAKLGGRLYLVNGIVDDTSDAMAYWDGATIHGRESDRLLILVVTGTIFSDIWAIGD